MVILKKHLEDTVIVYIYKIDLSAYNHDEFDITFNLCDKKDVKTFLYSLQDFSNFSRSINFITTGRRYSERDEYVRIIKRIIGYDNDNNRILWNI